MSKQKKEMIPDPDALYKPLTRIYPDKVKMDNDNHIIYDGLYHVKVRNKLDFNKYMVYNVVGKGKYSECLPKEFCENATKEIEKNTGIVKKKRNI